MKPLVPAREAFTNPDFLAHALPVNTPFRPIIYAMMGEELTDEEREVFRRYSGREREPLQRVSEFSGVIGRRGLKTIAMSGVASYIAGCFDHSDSLARGEVGHFLCVAQDTKTASAVLGFVHENFTSSPVLRSRLVKRTSDSIELTGGITIDVRPSNFRRIRGHTFIGAICDELAFWYDDSAGSVNPDSEIIAAVRPGLLTTGGPLLMVSSPYAKRGVLWDTYRRHYGPSGSPRVLVVQGTTREFNPTIPQEEVDRALEENPELNKAEYLAQFRDDISAFVTREAVERCVIPGRYELPRVRGNSYVAFCDPSGG